MVSVSRPSYIENAIFGRKWINKLVLKLISNEKVKESFKSDKTPSPSIKSAQTLIRDQIHSLLTLFLEKEAVLSGSTGTTKAPSWEASQQTRVIKLVLELIASLDAMDDEMLFLLSWLSPMLESCADSSNETIRKNGKKLLLRLRPPTTSEAEQPTTTQ